LDVNAMSQQQQHEPKQLKQSKQSKQSSSIVEQQKHKQSTKSNNNKQNQNNKQQQSSSEIDDDDDDEKYNDDSADNASEDNSNEDSSNDAATDSSELQVEFTLNDANENDFHTLKSLLSQYIPTNDESFPLSSLCELITQQSYVGSMIRSDGSDTPFGFATVLSFSQFKSNPAIQYILKYLIQKCPTSQRDHLKKTLSSSRTALFIQHRLLNMPQSIVPALHASLRDDLAWAVTKESNLTLPTRQALNIDTFIMIARCFDESKQQQQQQQSIFHHHHMQIDASTAIRAQYIYLSSNESRLRCNSVCCAVLFCFASRLKSVSESQKNSETMIIVLLLLHHLFKFGHSCEKSFTIKDQHSILQWQWLFTLR
jgi:hypothetical protein